jgi:hypothetical protein
MPKAVKFITEYSHQLDAKFRKSWPSGWTGELDDDIAFAARKISAIEFTGTSVEQVEEAEAWFADRLKMEKKAEKAAAAAAKKGAEAEPEPDAGDEGRLV